MTHRNDAGTTIKAIFGELGLEVFDAERKAFRDGLVAFLDGGPHNF